VILYIAMNDFVFLGVFPSLLFNGAGFVMLIWCTFCACINYSEAMEFDVLRYMVCV
jgi:hypothetical protein